MRSLFLKKIYFLSNIKMICPVGCIPADYLGEIEPGIPPVYQTGVQMLPNWVVAVVSVGLVLFIEAILLILFFTWRGE